MQICRGVFFLLLLLLAGAVLCPAQTVPQESAPETSPVRESAPVLIDRVLVIVDAEMILQSDLDREVELYYMEAKEMGQSLDRDEFTVREEILSNLVESKLIIAAAKQAEIEVEPELVQGAVDEKIAQLVQHFGSRDALERELSRVGMTLDDYNTRLVTQMMDQQYMRSVIGRFIRPRVEVLDNEVREFYAANEDDLPSTPDSLTIANILISVEASPEARNRVQVRVGEARTALADGEEFADVARRYSEGPNASRGGVLGVVARGDLFDASLEAAVFSLNVGEVSSPVVSRRGVHIVKLDAVTERGRAISQIFFPLGVTEADVAAALARADEVYARIAGGEDFGLVATEASADPVSARKGGFLGRFALSDLSPVFQEALAETEAGSLAGPVETAAGFYVFLVRERADGGRLPFDEVSEQIRRLIENQKLETELAAYVDSLRGRFFVDVKDGRR